MEDVGEVDTFTFSSKSFHVEFSVAAAGRSQQHRQSAAACSRKFRRTWSRQLQLNHVQLSDMIYCSDQLTA